MIKGYYGNYTVRMDEKGRVALPAKLRPPKEESPKEFVLTLGLDGCAALYPEDEWERILARLNTLEFTSGSFRNFGRQLFSAAVTVTPDRQGRMLVPVHLRDAAKLDGEVLVLGSGNYIEIWNPDNYDKYLSQYGQSYEQVAEDLFPKYRPPEE